MRLLPFAIPFALVAALAAGCGEPPLVVQGRIVSVSPSGDSMVVRDERPPNPDVTCSIEGADIGAVPQPGDEVRIAYRREGTGVRALRVMNLTRQAELGRASSGGH